MTPRPYAECKKLFAVECKRLAENAHDRYCANINILLYLCGTKRADPEVWEQLCVVSEWDMEQRSELLLIHGEHVPRNQTIDHLAETMRRWLSREPLWCFAD